MCLASAGVLCVCAIAPAQAQDETVALPVDAMTCEQISAELVFAGQGMSQNLDPEFAVEAQAMFNEAQAAQAGAAAAAPACATGLPGACAALESRAVTNNAEAAAVAQSNMARMNAQMGRLQGAMAAGGLDLARMMALTDRVEELGCEVPQ
jgi:hypothetical protein